jgi:hypothetical protein
MSLGTSFYCYIGLSNKTNYRITLYSSTPGLSPSSSTGVERGDAQVGNVLWPINLDGLQQVGRVYCYNGIALITTPSLPTCMMDAINSLNDGL